MNGSGGDTALVFLERIFKADVPNTAGRMEALAEQVATADEGERLADFERGFSGAT